jgi:hypothetical protein
MARAAGRDDDLGDQSRTSPTRTSAPAWLLSSRHRPEERRSVDLVDTNRRLRRGTRISQRRWLGATVLVVGTLLVATWLDRPHTGGDTPFVLDGTTAFLQCVEARVFVACGHTGELNDRGLTGSLAAWPLLQHVPDLAAVALGADGNATRARVLAVLSVVAMLASLLLGAIVLRRTERREWTWGYVFVLLTGPTLTYARSTNGEVLAMGLLVALVSAAVLRAHPALLALAAFGASVTKETAYPFVAALGLLGLVLARRRTNEPIGVHVVAGAMGVVAALVATSLFNIVRFGSVLNTNYLEPELQTKGIVRTLEYVAAVLVSPSGGILVAWATASVVLAACLLPALRSGATLDRRPALLLAVVTAALVVGFARWWAPFGWAEYGPRLMLPWPAPLLLLGLVAYGDAVARHARRLLTPVWRTGACFLAALVLTIPHIGHLRQPETIGEFFAIRPCTPPFVAGWDAWHDCQHELMWSAVPMPVYAANGVRSVEGVVTTLVLGAGLLACLLLFRQDITARVVPPAESDGARSARTAASSSRTLF